MNSRVDVVRERAVSRVVFHTHRDPCGADRAFPRDDGRGEDLDRGAVLGGARHHRDVERVVDELVGGARGEGGVVQDVHSGRVVRLVDGLVLDERLYYTVVVTATSKHSHRDRNRDRYRNGQSSKPTSFVIPVRTVRVSSSPE